MFNPSLSLIGRQAIAVTGAFVLTVALLVPGSVAADMPAAGAADDAEKPFTERFGRRLGESCFFGAGAGAASTLLASAPLIGQGLSATGAMAIALGAAGVGCTVGFAGAATATTFNYMWDQGWFWGQESPATDTPELMVPELMVPELMVPELMVPESAAPEIEIPK